MDNLVGTKKLRSRILALAAAGMDPDAITALFVKERLGMPSGRQSASLYDTAPSRWTWFIYALIDPRTKKRFYIGLTTNPKRRLAQHNCSKRGVVFPVVKKIRAAGLRVEMKILFETNTPHEAARKEARLIQRYRKTLVNQAGGIVVGPSITRGY